MLSTVSLNSEGNAVCTEGDLPDFSQRSGNLSASDERTTVRSGEDDDRAVRQSREKSRGLSTLYRKRERERHQT
jgi:hypothetical protein